MVLLSFGLNAPSLRFMEKTPSKDTCRAWLSKCGVSDLRRKGYPRPV